MIRKIVFFLCFTFIVCLDKQVIAQTWSTDETPNQCLNQKPAPDSCACPPAWTLAIANGTNCMFVLPGETQVQNGCLYNGGNSCGVCGENGTGQLNQLSCWSGSESLPFGSQHSPCTSNSQCPGGPSSGGLPRNTNLFR